MKIQIAVLGRFPQICACLVALVVLVLHGEDWPQFRGKDGFGISDGSPLPVFLNAKKNLVWKTALPGGHSSPVLLGDHIYLTGFEGKRLFTLCLERSSGRVLWKSEAPHDRSESYQPTNTPASPTPVTDGKRVYVFFGDFGLIAYSTAGEEVWKLPLGPFNNVNGHGSSPVLAEGKLFLICDQDTGSFLVAVDAVTGKVIWRVDRPEVTRGYATPGIFKPKSGPMEVIAPGAFQVIAYALETGEKLWWVRGMAWQLKSVPLIDGEVAYVNGWETGGDADHVVQIPDFGEVLRSHDKNADGVLGIDEAPEGIAPDEDFDHDGTVSPREWEFRQLRRTGQNNLVAIRLGGRGDITDSHVLWRYRKSLPNVPSPLLYRNVIYLVKDGGVVTALNPKTGDVFKQARLPGATENYWASPVAGDGKIYLVSAAGKVSVLKASGDWEVLGLSDLQDECFATPAISEGRIYLRSLTHLYCFSDPR